VSEYYNYTMKFLERYENPQLRNNVLTVGELRPILRFMARMAGTLDMLSDELMRLDKRVNEKSDSREGESNDER